MMHEIFISYRRDDEAGTTGRIYDHLTRDARVPKKSIFKDVAVLVPGVNFVREIHSRVGACELLLAVIGRRWAHAVDETGSHRLSNPDDFVRIEIEAGLGRAIPIIPLLIDGAKMPARADIPETLWPLCEQHALEIRNSRFETDMGPLVRAIAWHRKRRPKPRTMTQPQPQSRSQPRSQPKAESQAPPSATASAPVVDARLLWARWDRAVASRHQKAPPELKALGGLYYLAEAGDPLYLYEVATRLESGHGTHKNLRLARDYYTRAAKAGYAKALLRLDRLS